MASATHRDGSLPRSPHQALIRAKNTGTWEPGMCANFVASMYGAVGLGGYASAMDQWQNIPDRLKNNGGNAPKGALIFWGEGYGHVAISAGGGYVYTTDFNGNGTVSLAKVSDISQQWGKPLLGWSQPYWGGHTVKMDPKDTDAPPEAANAGKGGGEYMGRGDQNKGGGNDYGNYGYVKEFTRKHPAIAKLIDQARAEGWTPERLAYEIKDTDWWANHTEAQRKWQLLSAESPKEARDQIHNQRLIIEQMAGQSGVQLGDKEARDLAERAARNGWDSADIQMALSRKWDGLSKGQAQTGLAGDAAQQIDQMIFDYGVPVDRKTRERWIRDTLAGRIDPTMMEDRLREQAKTLYPNAGNLLNTQSLRQIVSPYLAAAAEELGVPPEQMNLTDPKWTRMLSGENGIMSLDEWTRVYRNEKRYGWDKSDAAKTTAAALAGDLARMMGSGF